MLKLSFGGVIESFVQVRSAKIVAGGIKIGCDLQRLLVVLDRVVGLVMCVRFDSSVKLLDRAPEETGSPGLRNWSDGDCLP